MPSTRWQAITLGRSTLRSLSPLDLQGGYLFRQRRADRRNGAFLGLRQFITACFHSYASVQRTQLANARVTALLDDEETMRLLQDVAARNTN